MVEGERKGCIYRKRQKKISKNDRYGMLVVVVVTWVELIITVWQW